jgi:hypothetical protein
VASTKEIPIIIPKQLNPQFMPKSITQTNKLFAKLYNYQILWAITEQLPTISCASIYTTIGFKQIAGYSSGTTLSKFQSSRQPF